MALSPALPVSLKTRKLLGARLELALPDLHAADLIEWPNYSIDKNKALYENGGPRAYVKVTFHSTNQRAMTMGPKPRVQNDGFMRVGINSEAGIGEDIVDIIEGRVLDAFPYSEPLVRDGLALEITRRLPGTANPVDGWYYKPLSIYWTLWRAT